MIDLGFRNRILNEKNIINRRCLDIAHHTIRHLLQNTDWEIVSLDRLDYSGNLNRIADMMNEFDKETQKRVRIVYHDLRAEVNEMLCADLVSLIT